MRRIDITSRDRDLTPIGLLSIEPGDPGIYTGFAWNGRRWAFDESSRRDNGQVHSGSETYVVMFSNGMLGTCLAGCIEPALTALNHRRR